MTRRGLLRGRPRPQHGTLTCASVLSASVTSAGEALASCAPSGMPWPSTNTIHFVPLPRLVLPTPAPPFSPPRSCHPGTSPPSPAAGRGSARPARHARIATKAPAPPTAVTAASKSARSDTAAARSRHRAPVCSTQRMPSTHSRFEAQGRPRPSRLRLGSGKKYSINAHCRSLSRMLPAQPIPALIRKCLP